MNFHVVSRGEECDPLGHLKEDCGVSAQGWKAGDGICKTLPWWGQGLLFLLLSMGVFVFFKQSLCLQQREWIGGSKTVQHAWCLIVESKL